MFNTSYSYMCHYACCARRGDPMIFHTYVAHMKTIHDMTMHEQTIDFTTEIDYAIWLRYVKKYFYVKLRLTKFCDGRQLVYRCAQNPLNSPICGATILVERTYSEEVEDCVKIEVMHMSEHSGHEVCGFVDMFGQGFDKSIDTVKDSWVSALRIQEPFIYSEMTPVLREIKEVYKLQNKEFLITGFMQLVEEDFDHIRTIFVDFYENWMTIMAYDTNSSEAYPMPIPIAFFYSSCSQQKILLEMLKVFILEIPEVIVNVRYVFTNDLRLCRTLWKEAIEEVHVPELKMPHVVQSMTEVMSVFKDILPDTIPLSRFLKYNSRISKTIVKNRLKPDLAQIMENLFLSLPGIFISENERLTLRNVLDDFILSLQNTPIAIDKKTIKYANDFESRSLIESSIERSGPEAYHHMKIFWTLNRDDYA